MLRGVYGDRERFESTYFSQFKGYYVTGDNVRRDGTAPEQFRTRTICPPPRRRVRPALWHPAAFARAVDPLS